EGVETSYTGTTCDTMANFFPDTTQVKVNSTYGVNFTEENIYCYAEGADVDGDTLSAYYVWYNGSTPMINGYTTGITNDTLSLISTLGMLNTTHDDVWKCSVKFYDGYNNETNWENQSILIKGCGVTLTWNVTLHEDLNATGICLMMGANSLYLNCSGYALTGDGTGNGFRIQSRTGVTIKNCVFENFEDSMYVLSSQDITLLNNTARYNTNHGAYISSVNDSVLERNIIHGNAFTGSTITGGKRNNITNNTFYNNTVSIALYGGLYVTNSKNTTIDYNNLSYDKSDRGIELVNSNDTDIFNNTFEANKLDGIRLISSYNVEIKENIFQNGLSNQPGINLYCSSAANACRGIHIHNNTFTNHDNCVTVGTSGAVYTRDVNISSNYFSGCDPAVTINSNSRNTSVENNIFTGSVSQDLYLWQPKDVYLLDNVIEPYYVYQTDNLTIENSSTGKIEFLQQVATSAASGSYLIGSGSSSDIAIDNNYTYVDSTNEPGFNVSANITMYNLAFGSTPTVYADRNDDGYYEENGTLSGFAPVNSYSSGTLNFNSSFFSAYVARANGPPTITSASASVDPIEPTATQTVTPSGQDDPDQTVLDLVCCEDTGNTCTPTTGGNICTGGNWQNQAYPYSSMTCTYAVDTTQGTHYVRCRTWDGTEYSSTTASDTYEINITAPTNLNAYYMLTEPLNNDTGNMTLTWTDNSNQEDGFKIERKTNSTSWSQITTVGAGVTYYSNDNINDNTHYWYRVRAYKGAENSAYSNGASNITADRTGPYNTVFDVTSDNTSNEMDINWSDMDDDMILYMPFEEGVGTATDDWSKYRNDGTITGAAWVTGNTAVSSGNALDFEGVDYVTVPASAVSPLNNYVTVTLWQYGDAVQPQADTLFNGIDTNSYRVILVHLPYSAGTVYWDAGNSGGATYDRISKVANTQDYEGRWNHWAFTKNAVSGDMKIYLNGALWHTGTGKTRTMSGITSFKIGSHAAGTSNYDGIIDEFRVYNRTLTQEEIIDDYQSGLIRYELSVSNTSSGTYKPVGGVYDYFADGNYNSDPVWTVSAGSWTVTSGYLRTTTGLTSKIYTPSTQAYGLWEWKMNMSEKQEFWLTNNNQNMWMSTGQGYLIYLYGGETRLAKSTGSTSSVLANISTVNDGNWSYFKVLRDTGGNFKVYKDDVFLFNVTDNTYTMSSYIGMFAWDIAANGGGFDEIVATPLIADNNYTDTEAEDETPPAVPTIVAETQSDTGIDLTWSATADSGDDYFYYMKAYDADGNIDNNMLKDTAMEENSYSGTGYGYWNDYDIVPMGSLAIGDTFVFEGEVKVNANRSLENGQSRAYIWSVNSTGNWKRSTSYGTTSTDWVRFRQIFTITESYEAEIRVGVYHFPSTNDNGTSFVRKLQVRRVESDTITTGFDHLRVQTNITGSWLDVENDTASPTSHTSLTPNTTHWYRAYSVDGGDNEQLTPSSLVYNITEAEQPTITAVDCGGIAGAGYICNVTYSMGNNPAGTNHYINETTGASGATDQSWTASTAVYQDTSLAAHTQYCYRIKARNGEG
ncbi:MAG: right-handed parallel beta-helix repeat-containing protein, partial [Gammaproteobacteria bacterium]|nr:right-handed parallel beta-helix repeat-containing protein [Gammaproteobacteria bacterium]